MAKVPKEATEAPEEAPEAPKDSSPDVIVIVSDTWEKTGQTFPKPEDGFPARFKDPEDPAISYERCGTDAETQAPLYRKVS